jgi:hypothetical protein
MALGRLPERVAKLILAGYPSPDQDRVPAIEERPPACMKETERDTCLQIIALSDEEKGSNRSHAMRKLRTLFSKSDSFCTSHSEGDDLEKTTLTKNRTLRSGGKLRHCAVAADCSASLQVCPVASLLFTAMRIRILPEA